MRDIHNCETNAKVVHLLDSRFPVFNLDRTFSVGEYHNFARPSLLVTEESVLSLNADDESVDCYGRGQKQQIPDSNYGVRSPETVEGSKAASFARVPELGCAMGMNSVTCS